jgi:hypothetical protein
MIIRSTRCRGVPYASSQFLALGAQNGNTDEELTFEQLARNWIFLRETLNAGNLWLIRGLKKETQQTFLNMHAYG